MKAGVLGTSTTRGAGVAASRGTVPSTTEPESATAIPARRPRRWLTEWSVIGKTMAEVGALPERP